LATGTSLIHVLRLSEKQERVYMASPLDPVDRVSPVGFVYGELPRVKVLRHNMMLIGKIGHSEASILTRLDSGDLDIEHDPDPVKDNPPPAVCMTPAQFGRSAVGAKNTQTYLQKLPRLFADRGSRFPLLTSWEQVCAKAPGYFQVVLEKESLAKYGAAVIRKLQDLTPPDAGCEAALKRVAAFAKHVEYLGPPVLM
ncbi:unnamed protein product, partial [Effrenium voratum]